MPSHPSHPDANGSVDLAPPGSRRGGPPPITLESLDERLVTVERHVEDLTSTEPSIPTELLNIRRVVAAQAGLLEEQGKVIREVLDLTKANGTSLVKITEVIGESPDSALDKAGSGLRKQVADLVVKSKAPTIVTAIGGAGMGLYALFQLLKAVGVLK